MFISNSRFHMVYLGGIVGLLAVIGIWTIVIWLMIWFVRRGVLNGVLLMTILVYWMVMANFLVFFEVPYNAIPFWVLLGMTFAYYRNISDSSQKSEG